MMAEGKIVVNERCEDDWIDIRTLMSISLSAPCERLAFHTVLLIAGRT
jgi:hypothetical protein